MPEKKEIVDFTFTIKPIYQQDSHPIWINYANFFRIADNFILDVGYPDLQKVAELKTKYPDGNIPEGEMQIEMKILSRFALSTTTFLELRHNIEEFYQRAVALGAIPKQEEQSH